MTDIIKIKNKEEFNKKINNLKADGINSLHIMSDFDNTLTKSEKTKSMMAILRDDEYLTPDYPEKARNLYNKYHPFEIDPKLNLKEKSKKMLEWWGTHIKLLVASGMNKEVIDDIIKRKRIHIRDGFFEFAEILSINKIPFLIFSSGLGDFIKEYLKSENKLTKNIHIISNFFDFDKNGIAKGYKSKILHTFNKREAEIKNTPYYEEIKERKNIILLGDSLGDLQMSKGLEHDCILRIAFLAKDEEKHLDKFMESYDLIISQDGSMAEVNNIIKQIISG